MILDKELLFSDQQSLIAAVGTVTCSNAIDLGAPGTPSLGGSVLKDLGRGKEIQVFAQIVDQYLASGGASTLQVQLIMSAAANLGSPTVIASSQAIAKASLVVGYQFLLRGVPHGVSQRYLGMQYLIATNDCTAGKITAALIMDRQSNPSVVG